MGGSTQYWGASVQRPHQRSTFACTLLAAYPRSVEGFFPPAVPCTGKRLRCRRGTASPGQRPLSPKPEKEGSAQGNTRQLEGESPTQVARPSLTQVVWTRRMDPKQTHGAGMTPTAECLVRRWLVRPLRQVRGPHTTRKRVCLNRELTSRFKRPAGARMPNNRQSTHILQVGCCSKLGVQRCEAREEEWTVQRQPDGAKPHCACLRRGKSITHGHIHVAKVSKLCKVSI